MGVVYRELSGGVRQWRAFGEWTYEVSGERLLLALNVFRTLQRRDIITYLWVAALSQVG